MRQVPTPARQVAQPSNKATPLSNPRKRALNEEDIEELSPKRKKIKSTSNYIYQTLFRDGINSDLTIRALGTYTVLTVLCCIYSVRHCTGKEWKLHKVYLCQVRVCVCGVYVCVCVRPPPPSSRDTSPACSVAAGGRAISQTSVSVYQIPTSLLKVHVGKNKNIHFVHCCSYINLV